MTKKPKSKSYLNKCALFEFLYRSFITFLFRMDSQIEKMLGNVRKMLGYNYKL